MNNRGFGLRDEIAVGIVMFILLLFVTIQIKNMYASVSRNTSNGNVVEPAKEEQPKNNIDVYYYYNLEDKVKTASSLYLKDKDIDLNNKVYVITSDKLIESGLLTELVDEDNRACTSNSLVSKDKYDFIIIDVYLKCNKYSTDDYKGE